jgi:hypothetical protein
VPCVRTITPGDGEVLDLADWPSPPELVATELRSSENAAPHRPILFLVIFFLRIGGSNRPPASILFTTLTGTHPTDRERRARRYAKRFNRPGHGDAASGPVHSLSLDRTELTWQPSQTSAEAVRLPEKGNQLA